MEKVIEITARREGFRRCGVAHSATTKTWPADAFTPEQLAMLKADPMLIVVERDKASGQNDEARGDELAAQLDAERQKVSELTAQLEEERQKVSELTAQLEEERQKVSELTAQLEEERQKVSELTEQLNAAQKTQKANKKEK